MRVDTRVIMRRAIVKITKRSAMISPENHFRELYDIKNGLNNDSDGKLRMRGVTACTALVLNVP